MSEILENIEYLHPNIGYIPQLKKYFLHGFSWGKGSSNMLISLEDSIKAQIEARVVVQKFLETMNMGNIKDSVIMLFEHSDCIVALDKENYNQLKPHRYGRGIKCDAIFTDQPDIAITAKPADCTTALIFAKRENLSDVVGIVHSGRRGVEVFLPQKAIKFLVEYYKCCAKDIYVGIIPHLFQKNRRFENLDTFDIPAWEGYIKKDGSFYYPAETEFAIAQYLKAGIRDVNLFVYEIDTYAAAERGETFSHKYYHDKKVEGVLMDDSRFIVAVMKRR